MEITRIIGIGIVGTILSVLVRTYRPELGICAALATGIAVIAMCIPHIESVLADIYAVCEQSSINIEYFKAILKIIGIAYLTQFASEIAKDAGEGAVAKKMELAGKTAVIVIMMPIVKSLMKIIIDTLAGI